MSEKEALLGVVLDLLTDSDLAEDAGLMVYAAIEGEEALQQAIGGTAPEPDMASFEGAHAAEPAGAYLTGVTVEGFRGIGKQTELSVRPGPGLTVVTGRNGSGKSSFAEAIEIALTGENQRWSKRTKDWSDGWRNLHHPHAEVSVGLLVEGSGQPEARVVHAWTTSAGSVEDATSEVRRRGLQPAPLSALGWDTPLVTYRPLLSHNQLGDVLEKPSTLFDALSSILGLADVTDGVQRLKTAVTAASRSDKEAKALAKALTTRLDAADEARATQAAKLLRARKPDLSAVEALVSATATDIDDDLQQLMDLTRLPELPTNEIMAATNDVREAAAAIGQRFAAPDQEAADLIRRALHWREGHGDGRCPVCEQGELDAEWARAAREKVDEIQALAAELRAPQRDLDAAVQQLRKLMVAPPWMLADATLPEAVELRGNWDSWLDAPTQPAQLADHVDTWLPILAEQMARVASSARSQLDAREGRWRPMLPRLNEWLTLAHEAQDAAPKLAHLQAAQKWLSSTEDAIRNERLRPIATEAAEIWSQLRQESNIEFAGMKLVGANTRRKAELDVRVDGTESSALAVMSQGELNALALSVFLPRATVPESPFRFLVIDDPVQAMDPSKVDGLARVLHRVATTRQVIVFTHDDRLPQALNRLRLDAHVLEVTRGEESEVGVRTVESPPRRYWLDARALLKDQSVSDQVAARVVPGVLRSAVEAACQQRVRRTRLGKSGSTHAEVESLLSDNPKLLPQLALALFDDPQRASDVYGRLNNAVGYWAGDLVKDLNAGAHGLGAADRTHLESLCHDTRRLIEYLDEWGPR